MFKKLLIALVMVATLSLAAPSAEAFGGLLLFRAAQNRAAIRNVQAVRQFNRQAVIVNGRQQIIVGNHFNQFDSFRQQFVVPQRNVRIVEVPGLNLRQDLVVERNRFGQVIDVRRQNVVEIRPRSSITRGNKIIIQQQNFRGY